MASALGILWNILEQSKLLFGLEVRHFFFCYCKFVNEVFGMPLMIIQKPNFVHSDIIVSQPFTIIRTTENDH